jgi:hypothetical protein
VSVEERRTSSRLIACIPAYLDSIQDEHDLALIRDVSTSGARLLTRTKLPVGLSVHLELYVRGDAATPSEVSGHVVRSDRRDIALSDVWPWEVAIEFEVPLEDAHHEIEELSERQLAMGIIKPPSERPG